MNTILCAFYAAWILFLYDVLVILTRNELLAYADEGPRTLLELCFWEMGTALLSYC